MWRWLLGTIALVALVGILVVFVPKWVVPGDGDATVPDDPEQAEKEFRATLTQFAVGTIVLFGTALTLYTNRDGQITERFTGSVDKLGETGENKLEARLGAIYALERTARSSTRDRRSISEVLTAFLREHARFQPENPDTRSVAGSGEPRGLIAEASTGFRRGWQNRGNRDDWSVVGDAELESKTVSPPPLRADIQAVATVLGRNRWSRRHHYDLREVDLHGACLYHAYLEGANLTDAHLDGAVLRGAHLKGVKGLTRAQVEQVVGLHEATGVPPELLDVEPLSDRRPWSGQSPW